MKKIIISLFGIVAIGFPLTVGASPASGIGALCYYIQDHCEPIEDPDPSQCPNDLVTIYDNSCTSQDMDGDRTVNYEDTDMDGDGVADLTEFSSLGTNPTLPDTDGDGHCDGTRNVCRGNGGVCRGEITDFSICQSPNSLADPCPANPGIDGTTDVSTYSDCQIIQQVETVVERIVEQQVETVVERIVETERIVVTIDPDLDNDGVCDQASLLDGNTAYLDPVTGDQICSLFNGTTEDNCPFTANPDQADVCNRGGDDDPNTGGYATGNVASDVAMGGGGGCSLIPARRN
ncbi:MAG: hypothetical protein HYY44_09005 [Deltaproteobacteria bacterium]|nr:hypothetical protein [Deltaproteobacteria bacterium]MBI4373385.1 hypothetical protein [Deltaproteobacteria bacterium]